MEEKKEACSWAREKTVALIDDESVRPSVTRRRVPTFGEAVGLVEKQIGYRELADEMIEEKKIKRMQTLQLIVRVMADVMCKYPGSELVIEGERQSAESVQDVYLLLDEAEAEELACRLEPDATVNTKAYVRAAIYNACIEGFKIRT